MNFPSSAIFAFNANIDHVKYADESDVAAIEAFLPSLGSQVSECFAYGVQKEVAIDNRACEFFLTKMKFEKKIVGGQAGNAAQQASALGVECFLHTNFASEELCKMFSFPEKVLLADEKGFAPATSFASSAKSAHHFVFENRENRTRFIASYDPLPMHLEDDFCRAIDGQLPQAQKAFVGGLHLVKTPDRLRKFISEISRWKEISPGLQVFFEMGEFQSKEVLHTAEKELFPLADVVGLNEVELAQLSADLDSLPSMAACALFHSPQEQMVIPSKLQNAAALEFAKRCASHKAKTGKFATEQDLMGASSDFVESPVETVGLGDAFSCAYFMCL